jgi:hypothetical protein
MALRTHNLPSGRLKIDLRKVDEVKFQGAERSCESIFFNLSIKKASWAMLLKCTLGNEKTDLDEFASVIF